MDRAEAIRIFLRVAELNSFTQAADTLGLPRSTVSEAVQGLETRLGVRLLQRTTRKVSLTHDGMVFYERGRDLLADMDEIQTMFQHGGSEISGRLRVDLPLGLATALVIPHLPEFLTAHPRLEVELGSTDRLVDLVREGYDCVLRVGGAPDSGLMVRRLGVLSQINCASPSYVATHGMPTEPDDLRGHRLVYYASVLGRRPDGFEIASEDGVRMVPVGGLLTVNNSQTYEAACIAGLGIIQAPEVSLLPHLTAGRLVEVLPACRAAPMPVVLMYAGRRHLPKRTRIFMDWLADVLRPHLR